jgi:hypothetical protein
MTQKVVTNLRGTFVENVKKIPKSTHPTAGVPQSVLNLQS